ncbi:gluconate 2-dehydrogenase subunit 3 family protein [Cellulophaga sp. 20_2_10]|uniref:gluconate 2-dehydrogenase subunit 3 family protein n=1 Tax=Cellulophaga sp. 20_2_10 TaxID=2942476 RepID=UPI00201A49F1|nr:gluconate 2-dehydrogenase subunit 3 family protein [Cellulophaga sp. 20_2_10]MCL5245349.1 gluconate 2-dehydrogenase subunit 3 family protein [Cellulophaga sp. 20_2_10]
MDRRKALMQMGMSLGYVVAVPTFVSILQSCEDKKEEVWTPTFFKAAQGLTLVHVVDSILPKTDTPSASEVNVHIFLDGFVADVMDVKQQNDFKKTLDAIAQSALAKSNKKEVAELTQKDVEPVVREFLEAKGKENAFVKKIRELTIWGYKCNEYVGEKVLAYLPIPGEFIACDSVEELTGGKAWSI